MRLFEYQAKIIFREKGIPLPKSFLARTKADISIGFFPAVYKGQVLSGGRGKAGGIKVVEDPNDSDAIFDQIMAIKVKGEPTTAVLIEEKIPILKEFYVSLAIDKQSRYPVFIASSQGGIEIEKVAHESPEEIIREPIDFLIGLRTFQIRKICKFLGISDFKKFEGILHAMYEIFLEEDATLVEINPLVETTNGLVALDAKMILDDKSIFRHESRFAELNKERFELEVERLSPAEKMAKSWDISFVKLDGNVGIISDGAGTGMLTLDMVMDHGGRPANFCELGGLGDADRMNKAIQVIVANPDTKVVLISLIGGLTRMDDMASGIVNFIDTNNLPIPIVVRMCGTREEEGRLILAKKRIFIDQNLEKVVAKAVEIAGN